MSKIRSSIPVCWTSLPLSRVIRWSRVGSGISSAVTIHVEVLAGGDRVFELDVPDRAVVEAGVAEDVAQGVGFSDVPARLPDDEGQFALVVEIARDLGAHHRLIVRDQGIDEPQEDRRVLRRGAAGPGGAGAIIWAGAGVFVRGRG